MYPGAAKGGFMRCEFSGISTTRGSMTLEIFQEFLSPLQVVLSGGRHLISRTEREGWGAWLMTVLSPLNFFTLPYLLPWKYTWLLEYFILKNVIKIIDAHERKLNYTGGNMGKQQFPIWPFHVPQNWPFLMISILVLLEIATVKCNYFLFRKSWQNPLTLFCKK